jgi:hypothetical protein
MVSQNSVSFTASDEERGKKPLRLIKIIRRYKNSRPQIT